MPAKNYYVVLGVSSDESPEGIRTAYRKLARRMHPDIAGPADTARFQEINEAYEVLSDPDRRRANDREFGEPGRVTEVPVRHEPPRWPTAPAPISLFGQPEQTKPSFDAFHERYLRNFTGWNVPKAERAESLTLDVTLSPAEAFFGCTIPVGVPAFGACPECGGTVFWQAEQAPGVVAVAVGAFAEPGFAKPHFSVWERRKHPWTGAIGELEIERLE